MSPKHEVVSRDQIEKSILLIRGLKVMLDSDLARLYGVPVKRLNEQVRRNARRFPADFMIHLSRHEYDTGRGRYRKYFTCGSGTTAYVAEEWGRRWITCDTSRVALTLAKQRLMAAVFDYYELAHPHEGVGSGFKYKTVPHITLKSIANNEPAEQEVLYDQPFVDGSRARVTGPFTVEAVPAPVVKPR